MAPGYLACGMPRLSAAGGAVCMRSPHRTGRCAGAANMEAQCRGPVILPLRPVAPELHLGAFVRPRERRAVELASRR